MTARHQVRRDGHFAIIPEWVIFHDDLSPQAIRLYAVLDRFADRDGESTYSRRAIAKALKVTSARTVDRAVDELVAVGALTVEARYDAAGDRTSNRYTLHNSPTFADADDQADEHPAGPLEDPEGVVTSVTPPLDTDVTTGEVADVATGGDTDCSASESQIEPKTPQPPTAAAAGGRIDLTEISSGCAAHPAPVLGCRACGTTPRHLARHQERQQKASEAVQRRADAAERARQRAEAAAAGVDPQESARIHAARAQARAAIRGARR